MKIEEKIAAISDLMTKGILTADEFAKIVNVLNGKSKENEPEKEKSPTELIYEKYITETISRAFKSPSSVKFPPFSESMVKEGTIKLDFKDQNLRYIETYIDAPNSYGAMLREDIIIVIDGEFNPLFWAQHAMNPLNPFGKKTKSWIKMN